MDDKVETLAAFAQESEKNLDLVTFQDEIQLFDRVVEGDSTRCRLKLGARRICRLQVCIAKYFVAAFASFFSRVCLNVCVLSP